MSESEIIYFIQCEFKELESRDVDVLFECIYDNLIDMRVSVNDERLYELVYDQFIKTNRGAK